MKSVRSLTAFAGLVLFVSSAHAGKPSDPPPAETPPPMPVLEQNLDSNGWIKVHEQGTAKVDIQNSSLDVNATIDNTELDVNVVNTDLDVNVLNGPSDPVSVNVENFPSPQSAPLPAVTVLESLNTGSFATGTSIEKSLNMNLVSFSINSGGDNDSYYVEFERGGIIVLSLVGGEATIHSFTYPIPVDTVEISCDNVSEDCWLFGSAQGFPQDP